jgi:hypothetical protein
MTRCHRAARFSTPKFDSLQPLPDYTPQSFPGTIFLQWRTLENLSESGRS